MTDLQTLDNGLALRSSLRFFARHMDRESMETLLRANLDALYPNCHVDLSITELTEFESLQSHTDIFLAAEQNDMTAINAGE